MEIVQHIVSGVAVAAILAAFGFLYHLYKKIDSLGTKAVKIGVVAFPETDPRASQFNDGLHKGWRQIEVPVKFNPPFAKQPRVIPSLQRFDLGDAKANIHRIGVRVEDPTPEGFVMVFETWEDSLIFKATASWIAIAE